MPTLANPKHEAFCQHRAAGRTLDEAYAEAGYKPSRQHAARLATKGNIRERLKEIVADVVDGFEITVEKIAKQLADDRAFARKCKQPGAAVAATMGLAKLGGLLTDKSSVVVTHNYQMMSEEEIRFELAALAAEARSIKPGVQH
jgi:phage terminase small subunit